MDIRKQQSLFVWSQVLGDKTRSPLSIFRKRLVSPVYFPSIYTLCGVLEYTAKMLIEIAPFLVIPPRYCHGKQILRRKLICRNFIRECSWNLHLEGQSRKQDSAKGKVKPQPILQGGKKMKWPLKVIQSMARSAAFSTSIWPASRCTGRVC